jgi:hypothetical protein
MTEYLFPDNTVLCNFAAVNRLDVIKSVLRGRGRWTEAVAFEASRSASKLPALQGLATEGWLDEPIEISGESDIQAINRIRRGVLGGTDDEPLKHLGEAQTCYIIKNWAGFAGSWWISDDRDAVQWAKHQGIITRETIDLMCMAVADGDIRARDAFDLMQAMADSDRYLRLPKSAEELQR